MMKQYLAVASLAAATAAYATPASAVTYTEANFSGAVYNGNANVTAPFTSFVSQGNPISGSFVFANELVPGAGSGYFNVSTADFPDLANIPGSSLFNINIGTLNLTGANLNLANGPLMIQYNNGTLIGFVGSLDFTYQNTDYRLGLLGSTFDLRKLVDGNPEPLGSSYINGYFNNGFTGGTAFTPNVPGGPTTGAVPEPATWAMLILGMGLVGAAMRRQRARVRFTFA